VLDNLDMALTASQTAEPDTGQSRQTAIKMVFQQLKAALAVKGQLRSWQRLPATSPGRGKGGDVNVTPATINREEIGWNCRSNRFFPSIRNWRGAGRKPVNDHSQWRCHNDKAPRVWHVEGSRRVVVGCRSGHDGFCAIRQLGAHHAPPAAERLRKDLRA